MLVNVARYSNINSVLGLNIISWWINCYFHHILYLRKGGTFLRNHGGTASSNKVMNFLSLFFYKCSCIGPFFTKIKIYSQSYQVHTWKISLCDGGTFMLVPCYFYPRILYFKQNMIFFFNFYLVPILIDGLKICFMMKKSIIKTFETSEKNSKFVTPSHLCDFGNGTSYFMT